MTRGEINQCNAALIEYRAAHRAYKNSYDAIGRYSKADAELRRLLWEHGPDLIELALNLPEDQ